MIHAFGHPRRRRLHALDPLRRWFDPAARDRLPTRPAHACGPRGGRRERGREEALAGAGLGHRLVGVPRRAQVPDLWITSDARAHFLERALRAFASSVRGVRRWGLGGGAQGNDIATKKARHRKPSYVDKAEIRKVASGCCCESGGRRGACLQWFALAFAEPQKTGRHGSGPLALGRR